MAKRIEIEKKFYCNDFDLLKKNLDNNNFTLIDTNNEVDEYFTDFDEEFIHNRTCLRIRKTNDSNMELTFKGKSKKLSNVYAKIENNISIPVIEYNGLKSLLFSLGYYSYTIVDKKRSTYSFKNNNVVYNVMIDQIKEVGNFVEFEILTYDDIKVDTKKLKEDLNEMINKFSDVNLVEANYPYRDFVAETLYKKISPEKELTTILFDLDGTLINSEKIFYQSFKDILHKKYNIEITEEDYNKYELEKNATLITHLKEIKKIEEDEKEEKIMDEVYLDYQKKFNKLIEDEKTIVNFELIRRLSTKSIKLGLVSTTPKKFINELIDKLDFNNVFDVIISREDVKQLKPNSEAYLTALKLTNSNSLSTIVFEDSKRGIEASKAAKIKTIKVNEFNISNEKMDDIFEIDSITRMLLILNVYL